ncbi:ABC transporter permease [Kitasatospora sp. NPDC089509]|uniref:ABC transporter permease n=1 Tax=Kitasatospora sp. NPDC089509 TaxID=3364079 RepID=UPI00382DB1E0
MNTTPKHRSWAGTRLVYRREIEARMATKGFLISMVALALVMFGLLVGLGFATAPKTSTVAVCGAPAEAFGPPPPGIRLQPCDDLAAARTRTGDQDVDAAVVAQGDRVTVLVRADTGDQAKAAATALAHGWATERAYRQQHVDTALLERTVAGSGPALLTVGDGHSVVQVGAAVSLVIMLFMQIIGQGSVIAQGVVEEKSTRIVEVLLATVTPLQLMVGKVAGIVTAAVVQVGAMMGAVVAARAVMGDQSTTLPGTGALAATVLWFLLSFLLFAGLFAAAGSLVSRPEDLQGVLMPVVLLAIAPVGLAAAAAASLNAGWVQVLQYVPPFSGLLMPLQSAVGNVSLAQQLAAAALTLLVTAGCLTLAARIYRNSILKVGAAVRWRHALTA